MMRNGKTALFSLLLTAAMPTARAQFQQPNPDELKMTADPSAPGAAAVYFDREETSQVDIGRYVYYARIKVLTEKGKELATVKVPYEHGDDKVKVAARTIHADGTIIPLNGKPDDLVELKTADYQENAMVFTLPSVDVGSVLEYRVQIDSQSVIGAPDWTLQEDYFIHQEHFRFDSNPRGGYSSLYQPKGIMLEMIPHDPPFNFKSEHGVISVDLTDVPAFPKEDWMPPMNTIRWRVRLYYSTASSAEEYWKKEAQYWSQQIAEYARVSGTIRKAAAGLVDPADSEEQKARKIYAAVQKLDNTDFSRTISEDERKKQKLKENNSAEDVWKNQSGPGNSVAVLFVALARAAGLKAWPMMVTDRSLRFFDYGYLNFRQMDDFIAIVSIGGKEVYLDPGQKRCPFGALYWAHLGTTGMRATESGAVLAPTPDPKYQDNAEQRTADVTIDAEGNATGTARIVLKGAESLYWRQRALRNSEDAVRKQFEEELTADLPEGVEAHFDHFVGLDESDSMLMAVAAIKGKIGVATGKRLIVPGLLFDTRSKHPFVAQEKRQAPVDFHYPALVTEDVVYRLPEGYTVESTPNTGDVILKGAALFRINSTAEDGAVDVTRTMLRNFSFVSPGGYATLRDFYMKIATADQQQIVLTRAAAAAGN